MAFSFRKLIKECVTQVLKEELEDPLYVEYISERPGEEPFELGGQKFQYVNAKYPNGKVDIGVYAFAGDIVYSYNAFRQMFNIQEGNAKWEAEGRCGECGNTRCNCKIVKRIEAYRQLKKQIEDLSASNPNAPELKGLIDQYRKERPWVQGILKQAGYGVQGGHYMREGFDPTSVGPNPEASEGLSDGNPYAAWNAKMRQMETNQHGRYAQEAGAMDMSLNDGFDEFRKEIGSEKVNEFLAKFGLGPNYKPQAPKLHECPQCKKCQAQYKEMHADTDMNEMVLECPDCGEVDHH